MPKIFAIVDCDSFYCSCELRFRPDIEAAGRGVVVLSNNDGCVIARSRTGNVRQLVKMGTPYFECREVLAAANVAVFSSRYETYAILSRMVMDTLSAFTSRLEVYSIDEAFLDLSGVAVSDLTEFARTIRDTVKRHTGIPVSIGIATTKTLAKVALELGKAERLYNGVVNLLDYTPAELEDILAATPVREVWGIGSRRASLCHSHSIYTALDLSRASDAWVRKTMTVSGLRTVHELRGISCLPLELAPPPKKAIIASKSFARPVGMLNELEQAVGVYMSRAAEKLRSQHSLAEVIQVWLHTSSFNSNPFYSNFTTLRLPVASNYTPQLISVASKGLAKIYRPDYEYVKAGVMLTGIVSEERYQPSLWWGDNDQDKKLVVGEVLDEVNTRWGRDTLRIASTGYEREWQTRRQYLSPAYLTDWQDLPKVRA